MNNNALWTIAAFMALGVACLAIQTILQLGAMFMAFMGG